MKSVIFNSGSSCVACDKTAGGTIFRLFEAGKDEQAMKFQSNDFRIIVDSLRANGHFYLVNYKVEVDEVDRDKIITFLEKHL